MQDTKAQSILRDFNDQLTELSDFRPYWGDIDKYIRPSRIPRHGIGGHGSKKDPRSDSTASNSSNILALAMQAGMIPKSVVWLLYRIPESDPARELNQNHRVAKWFQRFSMTVWLVMNRSNFHRTAGETFRDATSFHTAAGYSEENLFARGFQNLSYKSLGIGTYTFSEDKYGRADTMRETYLLTAHQAEQEFALSQELPPETLPEAIRIALKNGKRSKTFEFLRHVGPRPGTAPDAVFTKDMPFECLDIFLGEKERRIRTQPHAVGNHVQVVRESGYHEFPYWVWRWSTQSGEKWGVGQSDIALPAIRLINKTRMKLYKGLDQAIDPSKWVNPALLLAPPKFESGAINPTRDVNAVSRDETSGSRYDLGKVDVEGLRQEIKDIYFTDYMRLPGKTMTAEEVITLRNQLDRFLGPQVDSGEFDFLAPQTERAAATVLRAGLAPEAPPEMEGVNSIEPQFLGTLAKAQRMNDIEAMDRFLGMTGAMMDRFPEAGDNVDIDEVVKIAGNRLGIPENILRDIDAIDAIRQARREAMETEREQQDALNITKAIAQGADAEEKFSKAGVTF